MFDNMILVKYKIKCNSLIYNKNYWVINKNDDIYLIKFNCIMKYDSRKELKNVKYLRVLVVQYLKKHLNIVLK